MLRPPRMQEAITAVSPKSRGPCSIASCSWKSIRTAASHTSPTETPQGQFCTARFRMMVGYKTNVPHTSPPFPQPLFSCLLPDVTCYLCQKDKPNLAVPAGDKGQGCRLCSLTKTLKSGHSLFLMVFSSTAPQRTYLTTHGTIREIGTPDWISNFAVKVDPHHEDLSHEQDHGNWGSDHAPFLVSGGQSAWSV